MAATQLKPCLRVNRKGPYIGLITVFVTEKDAFFASGSFKPDPKFPFIDLSGRGFRFGVVRGRKVVYVRCGEVAATQQMVDLFDIKGIIHFGIAGNTNNSMSIGDVTIPNQIAHTGLWEWLNTNGTLDSADVAQLEIGDNIVPKGNGTNLLGEPNVAESLLWANISLQWLQLSSNLEGMKLEQCVNSSLCLTEKPKLVVGLRASTSNIFLDNAAYRDFLFQKFGTSLSNGYPVIVIRGLSDLAGNQEGDNVVSKFGGLAIVNSVKAVLGFIRNLPPIAC
ncbi:hypothetical protein V6Z11_A10G235600 [Gossypium hirsutum]